MLERISQLENIDNQRMNRISNLEEQIIDIHNLITQLQQTIKSLQTELASEKEKHRKDSDDSNSPPLMKK